MDCSRTMVYFSVYANGVKTKSAGYAAIFTRGENCDIQLYYRGTAEEDGCMLQPVYIFQDGTIVLGTEVPLEEGMGMTAHRTMRQDFMQSGRGVEELETIYLDGVKAGICGGRLDGRELEEAAYTLTDWVDTETVPEPVEREEEEPEEILQEATMFVEPPCEAWTLSHCMEEFPELKLPFDGMRRKCCRMELKDMEHLPSEWRWLKTNHFLLHGYYEYHHLLLAKLADRYGERYVIGVPGEFNYRNQYMAENFGFYDFAPLEPGRRRGGSFGYWYYYLERK